MYEATKKMKAELKKRDIDAHVKHGGKERRGFGMRVVDTVWVYTKGPIDYGKRQEIVDALPPMNIYFVVKS